MDSHKHLLSFPLFLPVFFVAGFLASWCRLKSQEIYNPLIFNNPVLINPSFAGLSGGSAAMTTFNSTYFGGNDLFNEFDFTYDASLEKIKSGIALVLKQNLYGNQNINTNEIGLAFSRKFGWGKGSIVPSVYFGYEKAVKNWYVYLVDIILNRQFSPPNPPGKVFQRFDNLIPGAAILLDAPNNQAGISAQINKVIDLTTEAGIYERPPTVTVFYSRKMNGRKNGLMSEPYNAFAEIILYYENDRIHSRIALNIDQKKQYLSFFNQDNFTDRSFSFGGTYGIKMDNLRLSFSNALGICLINKKFLYTGEVSLGIIIPARSNNLIYPFAPLAK